MKIIGMEATQRVQFTLRHDVTDLLYSSKKEVSLKAVIPYASSYPITITNRRRRI